MRCFFLGRATDPSSNGPLAPMVRVSEWLERLRVGGGHADIMIEDMRMAHTSAAQAQESS